MSKLSDGCKGMLINPGGTRVTTTANTESLPIHRAVKQAVGPAGLADLAAPVTERGSALVALILQALTATGAVQDPDAYAVLADPDRRDAYLEQVA